MGPHPTARRTKFLLRVLWIPAAAVVAATALACSGQSAAVPTPSSVATPSATPTVAATLVSFQTPPADPAGLTVLAISDSAIRLTWTDNSNDEAGFEMDNGTSDLGPVPANTTTWTKTGLASGTYMCFHIYAFNDAGHSGWTDYACTTTLPTGQTPRPTAAPGTKPPAAPSRLTVTAISRSAIRLRWSDNSTNETGFELSNGTKDLGPVPANTTTWTMTGLTRGKYMCFQVLAFNLAGQSAWTPYACTTTLR